MSEAIGLPPSGNPVFWGEIAPCEHIAQFYEHDGVLLDTLIGFISGGLKIGESTIVIATAAHLNALEEGLQDSGVDLVSALVEHRYIALLADKALDRFMVKQWPDDMLFANFVTELITRARVNGRAAPRLWRDGRTSVGEGRCRRYRSFGVPLESII